ncbi:restriction endonuclease subunit S [Rahnella woolbedingensis]|uniref:Restriction endonuclease subunit S n=1 Tax=Rahnella woolbedingensis TaxID=1510574 RepID=A0A419NBF7_9GAMM|nr:restriction endonuclease subunit S [Rahnella woolbedingensis]RJT45409.1 restriction endonuclease subunit S [Rahnella woolbedingensis]
MAVEQLITQHIDTWTSALQTRSTAGRGSNGKIDLYGIKKLRELILELAVRGKLVPQDPTDEPASELLKRVAAEKAELVKQGKIKKQKPLPEISEDEKPFELPVGWEWVRLGQLVEILDHQRKPVTKEARSSGEYPYYGASGIVDYIDDYIFDDELVLVGEDGAKWNKGDKTAFCISGKVWVNNHAHVIKPFNSVLLNEFVSCYLTAADLSEYITGTTVPKLNQAKLVSIPVPLSSLNTQFNICSKVNELMSLCDQLEQQSLTSLDAHSQLVETLLTTLTASQNAEELAENWARISQHFDTLFTTEASIDALKKNILQLAVMGKLVPQFGGDTPVKETYETICRIKEKLIKEKVYQKSSVLKPKSSKLSIPENWLHTQFGEVCCSIVPNRDKPKSFSGNIPWITLPSFDECNIYINERDSEIGLSPEEVKAFNARVIPTGSILMSCVGRFGLTMINKCEVVINQQIHAFIPLGGVVAEYLSFVIKASKKSLEGSSTSTTIAYLNKSNCESIEFGFPPLEEQKRIVDKVNELTAMCNLVKFRLQSAQQTQLHLADALTDAALT